MTWRNFYFGKIFQFHCKVSIPSTQVSLWFSFWFSNFWFSKALWILLAMTVEVISVDGVAGSPSPYSENPHRRVDGAYHVPFPQASFQLRSIQLLFTRTFYEKNLSCVMESKPIITTLKLEDQKLSSLGDLPSPLLTSGICPVAVPSTSVHTCSRLFIAFLRLFRLQSMCASCRQCIILPGQDPGYSWVTLTEPSCLVCSPAPLSPRGFVTTVLERGARFNRVHR